MSNLDIRDCRETLGMRALAGERRTESAFAPSSLYVEDVLRLYKLKREPLQELFDGFKAGDRSLAKAIEGHARSRHSRGTG